MGVTLIRHTQAHLSHPGVDDNAAHGEPLHGRTGEIDSTQIGDVQPEPHRCCAAVQKTGLGCDIQAFDDDIHDRAGPNGL
jgi:hypothetical protein